MAFDTIRPPLIEKDQMSDTKEDRLEGWKEIAVYLHIDRSTAKRWRAQGMPVLSVPNTKRGRVFASRREIDAWMRQRTLDCNAASTDQKDDPVGALTSKGDGVLTRRRLIWMFGTGVAIAGATVWFATRRWSPHAAEFRGRMIIALDANGDQLWTYELQREVVPAQVGRSGQHRIVLADLDGTGRKSILAWARYSVSNAGGDETELVCLDWRGKPRWRLRATPPLLDHDGNAFEDGWAINDLLVRDSGGTPAIWMAVHHYTRFASCLLRINPSGKSLVQFWPRGFVDRICTFVRDGHPMLALSGIDNSLDRPFLAVIDAYGPPVCAPLGNPDKPRYAFANAPSALAQEYVLLPDTEINKFYRYPYFEPRDVAYHDPVLEVTSNQGPAEDPNFYFEFTPSLKALKVRPNSAYASIHDEAYRQGILDHPFLRCPERLRGMGLLRWSANSTWENDVIPMAE